MAKGWRRDATKTEKKASHKSRTPFLDLTICLWIESDMRFPLGNVYLLYSLIYLSYIAVVLKPLASFIAGIVRLMIQKNERIFSAPLHFYEHIASFLGGKEYQ